MRLHHYHLSRVISVDLALRLSLRMAMAMRLLRLEECIICPKDSLAYGNRTRRNTGPLPTSNIENDLLQT